MSRRFSLRLLASAEAAGVVGPRIRHTRTGPRLVGKVSGRRFVFSFPGTAGSPRADRAACSLLRACVQRARRQGSGTRSVLRDVPRPGLPGRLKES